MNIGQLKEYIKDLPDDLIVGILADSYFPQAIDAIEVEGEFLIIKTQG